MPSAQRRRRALSSCMTPEIVYEKSTVRWLRQLLRESRSEREASCEGFFCFWYEVCTYIFHGQVNDMYVGDRLAYFGKYNLSKLINPRLFWFHQNNRGMTCIQEAWGVSGLCIFECSFDFSLCFFFCNIRSFVKRLFSACQSEFELDKSFLSIYSNWYQCQALGVYFSNQGADLGFSYKKFSWAGRIVCLRLLGKRV